MPPARRTTRENLAGGADTTVGEDFAQMGQAAVGDFQASRLPATADHPLWFPQASTEGIRTAMWRAIFLAVGITLCIVGAECLVVDHVVLAGEAPSTSPPGAVSAEMTGGPRIVEPPEWAPWSLMSAGAVVILYSLTLARPQ